MTNMKKSTKKAIVLCGTMLASLVCAGLLLQTKPVEASAATAASYAKIQGASVRYVSSENDETGNGLRFIYTVDKNNDFGTDFAKVEQMGMLMIPTCLMGENEELTLNTANKSDTKFIENGKMVEEHPINVGNWSGNTFTKAANGNTYGMFVYVYKLPENMYNQDFTCVGYYQLKNGDVLYTNTMERSIASVARAAYDAEAYTNQTQKTCLEGFLLDYTVTYDAGEGTASKASETLEYGKAFTATATLSGYDFDFWGVNGEKVETIIGDMTVSAHYKKDGGALVASLQNGVSMNYAGSSIQSAKLGEKDVTANVSIADGKLTVAGAAFDGEGSYSLTINETANKTATYSILVANSEERPFVFADASNIVAASQFGYNNREDKWQVESSVEYDGRKGLMHVRNHVNNVDAFAMTVGLESKAYYEALYDVENTYVTFEFYIVSSSSSRYYWDINGANDGWGNQTGSVTTGTWHRMSTPLADILNHYDEIDTAYTNAYKEKDVITGWLFRTLIPGDASFNMYITPMYFTTIDIDDMDTVYNTGNIGVDVGEGLTYYEAEEKDYKAANLSGYTLKASLDNTLSDTVAVDLPNEEGTYTYTIYAENDAGARYTLYVAKIALANSTLERPFATVSGTASAKAVEMGDTNSSKSSLEVVSNPQGKTGDYYKVTFTNANEPGIKILPEVALGMLEMYSDGAVRFDYYVETSNTTDVHILRRAREPQDGSAQYYEMPTVQLGKWYTAEIPVSEFLATVKDKKADGSSVTTTVYDRIVEGYTSNQHNGKLFALKWTDAGNNGVFYVGNMRLVSKEIIEEERGSVFTTIDSLEPTIKAWDYSTARTDELSVVEVTDAGDYNGTYYRYQRKAAWSYVRFTIMPIVENLAKYAGGTLSIKYKIVLGDGATTHQFTMFDSYYNSQKQQTVATNEWGTLTIDVDDLIANCDALVSMYNGSSSSGMALLGLQADISCSIDCYLGGFKLSK